MNDKYSATWVSHSSMGDFKKCPRSYFLKNVYKDPETGKKIGITTPALSLGSAVHEVVEGLAKYKAEDRINVPMMDQFEKVWSIFSGKRGGFTSTEMESETKARGIEMIKRVKDNIDPLLYKTVKLKGGRNNMPPNYFLSEKDNIILCGKIDWLQYREEDDSVYIIDFKTGKNEENEDSLQLPIYQLLLHNLQKRKVNGASYWYLDKDDTPKTVELPDLDSSFSKVYEMAIKVKTAREKKDFHCPNGDKGCFACRPLERILKGEAEYVGSVEWQDLYIVG